MTQMYTEELMVQFGLTFGTMVVRIWQPEQSRGTVFCIHGFTGNGSDFEYLADILARNQFTVICPDLVGRGKSSYFGDPKMYGPETYFRCIHALAKYAGQESYFIGTSWGGALMLLYLHRMHIRPTKLIFNDVCLKATAALDKTRHDVLKDSEAEFDTREEAGAYIRTSRGFLGRIPEALWRRYVDNKIIVKNGKHRLAYDPATTGNFTAMMGRDFDFFPLLPKLHAPTMLLYGAASPFYDERSIQDCAAQLPQLSVVADLNAGHPPSLMTFDQAMLVLGFLTCQS